MPDSPGKQKAFPDKHGGDSQKPAKPKASVRVERLHQREFASVGREQNCACTNHLRMAHNIRNHSVRRNKYAT